MGQFFTKENANNNIGNNQNVSQELFLFQYYDDNPRIKSFKKMRGIAIPISTITSEIRSHIDEFNKYGSVVEMQCFNFTYEKNDHNKKKPSWTVLGQNDNKNSYRSTTIFDEHYIKLKRLMRNNTHVINIDDNINDFLSNNKKIIKEILTVTTSFCFAINKLAGINYNYEVAKNLIWD
jgi:hypothetical protein